MIRKAKLVLLILVHCVVSYSQTTSSITLAWDPSAGPVSGYYVYAKNSGTSQTVKTDVGATTSAVIGALTQGQTYSIYMTAYNSSKVESVPSNLINYTVPSGPIAPSNLVLKPLGSQSIQATWADNSSNESGFTVWRRTDSGAYGQIASLGAGVTTFTDNSVITGPQYSYQVAAFNANGNSTFSAAASAKTGPYAPSKLAVAVVNSTQTRVTWLDNSTNETGFRVFRRLSGGSYAPVADTAANATSFVDGAVSGSTTYFYTVCALGAPFQSLAATEVSVFVPGTVGSPSSLVATALTSSQMKLSWTDNSTQEAGFRILRRSDTTPYAQVGTVGTNVTTFRDSGVVPGTHYFYEVNSYDASGNNSPVSNEAAGYTGPKAPSGLTASALNPTGIRFAWADNSSDETGFRVFRSLTGTNWTAIAVTSSNVTQWVDSNVTGGTRYYYTLNAIGSPFESAASNSVSVIAPGTSSGGGSTSATFIGLDSTTSGSWIGKYGSNGYWIEGLSSMVPSFLTVAPKGASGWTWVNDTTTPSALLRPNSTTSRIASSWYATTTFDFNLSVTDSQRHRVSAYFLDWGNKGLQERVDILDASTGAVLNSQTISNFSTGIYATWDISGRVILRVTRLAGKECDMSGLFF